MSLPQETIRKVRDGQSLSFAEMEAFITGLAKGTVSEAQGAAFAMAVLLKGLDLKSRVDLTRAMTQSGTILTWDVPGPVLDKHSTGGIGDAVSLVLAPMVACCGGYVPMISGRGLGHTGGTLDKLNSIPGYNVKPGLDAFQNIVRKIGCAIIGQTEDLAPADRILYAIRDVTGTVESLDLITASILSKKLAAGLHGLVMDVKFGNGAFMQERSAAQALADSLITVAEGAGLPTRAILTPMDQPLARCAGNAIEIAYALDYLTGKAREPRFHEITLKLASQMLILGRLAASEEEARAKLEQALHSGNAHERFLHMVKALGGPSTLTPDSLPQAPLIRPVPSPKTGRVTAIDTRALGLIVIGLGGGRVKTSDTIDPSVGLSQITELGQRIETGEPLAFLHAKDESHWQNAAEKLTMTFKIEESQS